MYNRNGIWQSALSPLPAEEEPKRKVQLRLVSPAGENPDGGTYLSIPLEMIPTDMPLPCSLYVRISEKFVLFRKVGDILTTARSQSLVGPSNGVIFVSLVEWNTLLHSLEAILIASQQAALPPNPVDHGLQIRNLLVAYAKEIEQRKSFTKELLDRIRELAEMLATIMSERPDMTRELLKRYQDPALYYINHAVNVAIYAIAIGKNKTCHFRR